MKRVVVPFLLAVLLSAASATERVAHRYQMPHPWSSFLNM